MKTIEATALVSTLRQKSEVYPQDEMEIEQTGDSHHPFGSVLFRLELALALICINRRQASVAQVPPRIRR